MIRRSSLAVLGLAVPLAAQTTWFVGPGGFGQIRDVTPLVAAGDSIEVAPGSYFPFRCTQGITIRALVPGTVTVNFSLAALPPSCGCTCLATQGPTRLAPPAGASLHVVGVTFGGYQSITPCFSTIGHVVDVASGRVTFDDCTIDRLRVDNAAVHLQECTLESNFAGPALWIANGDATLVSCSVRGAPASAIVGASLPGSGAVVQHGRFHASHGTITGGAPGGTSFGSFGIEAVGGSVWLSDATVTGRQQCAVAANGTLSLERCTLIGAGAGCATSPTGGPLTGIERNGPITIGQIFRATLNGDPGDLQIFYGSTGLAAPLSVPTLIEQPSWIDATTLFFSQVTVAGSAGTSTFDYVVPFVPALRGAEFWVQGVGGASFPLQTSPVVGGVVR